MVTYACNISWEPGKVAQLVDNSPSLELALCLTLFNTSFQCFLNNQQTDIHNIICVLFLSVYCSYHICTEQIGEHSHILRIVTHPRVSNQCKKSMEETELHSLTRGKMKTTTLSLNSNSQVYKGVAVCGA